MFNKFTVKKLVALLLVGAVMIPSIASAQTMPIAPVSIDVAVNGYPSNPDALLKNAYVNMYRVKPVIAGVYEGTLVSIRSTGSAKHATFRVRPNEIVDFVGFTDFNKARNTTRYTFTAPPYKNFSTTDGVFNRLCQINYLDKTTKMQSNGADSCGTSLGYPANDSSVVIVPKKYPARKYGNIEVWAQETNDPLTRVRGAEISLFDEFTGEKLGSAVSDLGIVTFVIETNRPFYYEATKDGKRYGGRLASATETPRVFVITSDRKHNQNYYSRERSAVMRLGAYPNSYQGVTPPPTTPPAGNVTYKCDPVDYKNTFVETRADNPGYYFLNGLGKAFPNKAEADEALSIVKRYKLGFACSINVPLPRTESSETIEYWLTANGQSPNSYDFEDTDESEDCISFDFNNLKIVGPTNGRYTLVEELSDGVSHLMFSASQAKTVRLLKDVLEKYNLNTTCYVGRPDPSMTYYKRTIEVMPPFGDPEEPVTPPSSSTSSDVTFEVYATNGNAPIPAYTNMYRVVPVLPNVYAGYLVEMKKTMSDGGDAAKFTVKPGEMVDFVPFTNFEKSLYATYWTFTTPPLKNFTDQPNDDKLCRINGTDKNSRLPLSDGGYDCFTYYKALNQTSKVVMVEPTDPSKKTLDNMGIFEVWVQDVGPDPSSLVKDADITLYDELTNEQIGFANSGSRGIVSFIIEKNRPFFYKATKNGKSYGGRLTMATSSPRVFLITSNNLIKGYYDNQTTAVLRLGAYPNTVTPAPTPIPAPTVSLSVSPTSITAGQSATLTWSSTNSTYCVGSGAWAGNQLLSGSKSISPNATTTYSLTCTGVGGSVKKSVTVTVIPVAVDDGLIRNPDGTLDQNQFVSSESCVNVNPNTLSTSGVNLTDSAGFNMAFPSGTEAATAATIIKKNQFTQLCTMTVPNTSFTRKYWLTAGHTVSTTDLTGEDCIGFNPAKLEIKKYGTNDYRIVEILSSGSASMLEHTDSLLTAMILKDHLMTKYDANQQCYVGRPDPSMKYYKKYTATSTQPCASSRVMYQGACVDPIPACKNPPANSVPSSCIDKIENGVYIERYNFSCLAGYTKSGEECVKNDVPVVADTPATVSLSASSKNIVQGQSTTLTWSTADGTWSGRPVTISSCWASGGWSGDKAKSGSLSVTPNITTTYTLQCITNAGSHPSASVTVTVTPAPSTACVKPASVTKAMFGGTSWTLPTTNKTYNVKVENVTSDNKVQFLINGNRLVGVTANAVPRAFSDFNSTNGNDGTIQVYSTRYSASGLNQSIVAFKISEKVPAGSTACSTDNELVRALYMGTSEQTYTTANGKTFVVKLERAYGGTSGNEKKIDIVINGDRMIGVPWDDNAKQHFGASHPGDDGTVTINFINNTTSPNFAVITILAD